MRIPRPQPGPWPWPRLRLPRRTARLRLTLLYSGVFLLCAVGLLGLTYLLVASKIPHPEDLGRTRSPMSGPGFAGNPALQSLPDRVVAAKQASKQAGIQAAVQQSAADLRQLQIQSGIALGIASVVAFTLGWLAAGRILRPLSTITATARRISATSLSERLNLPGPDDELKELGDTLDGLFARLEASFEAQRHFVANASHELRTPLTADRALLQVALDESDATADTWRDAGEELLASNTEQGHLIEALLTLATSEAGLHHREPVDLCTVIRAVLLTPRPETRRLGLRLEAATTPAVLDGDPVLTERLVANLVDNAVRHNIPGGWVQVATRTVAGRAAVSVVNTGPVIPPDQVDALFQPFHRLRSRRASHGHGLGLSIVHAIATAHGATVTAQALPRGGLAIEVVFPPPGRVSSHPARRGVASGV
jgi:signal transduction histidine kinase